MQPVKNKRSFFYKVIQQLKNRACITRKINDVYTGSKP